MEEEAVVEDIERRILVDVEIKELRRRSKSEIWRD